MILFAGLLGLSSCKSLPGLEEPEFYVCSIVSLTEMDCVHISDTTKPPFQMPIKNGLGFQCVDTESYLKISDHHAALHELIDKVRKKK